MVLPGLLITMMEHCSYRVNICVRILSAKYQTTDVFIDLLACRGNVTLEIIHLGSGSGGNSAVYKNEDTTIMIDCGFSIKQAEKRLSMADIAPDRIDHIFVTHHHADHSRSALKASKKWGAELHCNLETAIRLGWQPINEARTFADLDRIEVDHNLSVMPVPVPHDDADNVGFIISTGGERAAYVTDLGEGTDELRRHLSTCSHISIESNYDHDKLMNGPYPDSIKRRISGRGGHLSNVQTAELLKDVVSNNTKSIVLCHLSERNNAPHIAESEVLLKIDDRFNGDLSISTKNGPEFVHYLGEISPNRIL